MHRSSLTLLVTTYQANKLLVVRATPPLSPRGSALGHRVGGEWAGLSTLVRHFDKPMGLAVDTRRLALGTRNQIWFLRNAPDIALPGYRRGPAEIRDCRG